MALFVDGNGNEVGINFIDGMFYVNGGTTYNNLSEVQEYLTARAEPA